MRSPHHMRSMMGLTLAASLILRAPDVAKLIDIAEEADDFLPRAMAPRSGGFRRGLVLVSREEFTELGIPERSRRERFCVPDGRVQVDRRCLKRYRRKAGRRV